MQVDCSPESPITLFLHQLRLSIGGYVKLAVRGVDGAGTLLSVAIRPTPVAVRADISSALLSDRRAYQAVDKTDQRGNEIGG